MASRGAKIRLWPSGTFAAVNLCRTEGDRVGAGPAGAAPQRHPTPGDDPPLTTPNGTHSLDLSSRLRPGHSSAAAACCGQTFGGDAPGVRRTVGTPRSPTASRRAHCNVSAMLRTPASSPGSSRGNARAPLPLMRGYQDGLEGATVPDFRRDRRGFGSRVSVASAGLVICADTRHGSAAGLPGSAEAICERPTPGMFGGKASLVQAASRHPEQTRSWRLVADQVMATRS